MTSSEIESGKPLFSIQVDDVLVQEIFQKLAEQIAEQTQEIKYLKEELAKRPTAEEFTRLNEIVERLQNEYNASSSSLTKTVDDFYSSLESKTNSINDLIQTKINEMLFSVDAAIRGQIEMMDPVSANNKEVNASLTQMRLQVDRVSYETKQMHETILQVAAAFDGRAKIEGLTNETAGQFVRTAAQRDRNKIEKIENQFSEMTSQFETFKKIFENVLPTSDSRIPMFGQPSPYDRTKTPQFQTPPKTRSVFDFFTYVGAVLPDIETVVTEMHNYVSQIDATVKTKLDEALFTDFINDNQKKISILIGEADDYRHKKDQFILKQQFDDLSNDLYEIVNGTSNSALSNTRCVACGKALRTPQTKYSSRSPVNTARTVLQLDRLQPEPIIVKSPRSPKSALAQRPRTSHQ